MSKVAYNGMKLIPAPYASITKNYQMTDDGRKIGSLYTITLIGKTIAYKGSPRMATSSGSGWASPTAATEAGSPKYQLWENSGYPDDEVVAAESRLTACIRKQEAIKLLFARDGQTLEIQAMDGAPPMRCNPRVVNIDYKDGPWYEYFDYTITLEADVIYINNQPLSEDGFDEYIVEASENWQLEVDERPENELLPRTYRMVHTVAAKGKRFYSPDGTLAKNSWEQAKEYVSGKLGFDGTVALSSGINNIPDYYQGYNHMRSESIDEEGGRYSVVESWVLASGKALEDFNINIRESAENGLKYVSIDGTITGLETRSSGNELLLSKHHNADSMWTNTVEPNLLARCQLYSGYTLNPLPLSKVVGRNPVTGITTYSAEYSNRPSNLIPNSKSESITVSYGLYTDLFASVTVLGRPQGPVLQPLGTIGSKTMTLNIELVMPTNSYGTGSVSDIQQALVYAKPSINPVTAPILINIVNSVRPSNLGATQEYISDQSESWNASEGRYTYNLTYTYQ